MKISLLEQIKMDSNENEISNWLIDINEGQTIIDLANSTGLSILECTWVNPDKKFIDIFYSEIDGGEYHAIANISGKVIRKGLVEIRQYIKEFELFIVQLESFSLTDDEQANNNFLLHDLKVAVINKYGEFVLPQFFDNIMFDVDLNKFDVRPDTNYKNGFSMEGLRL